MSQMFEYISIAIMNIRHNKKRSILTMLGIIIGISSVILVLSIGNGMKSQINEELNGLAGGQIAVYVDTTRKDVNVEFDNDDVTALNEGIEHIKGASPQFSMWGTAESPKTSMDAIVYAGTEAYQYSSSSPIIKGRYFTEDDVEAGNLVCVISESDAKNLFGSTNVVGMTFEVTLWGISHDFKIVGVRENSNSKLLSMLQGSGYVSMEVPLTVLADKYQMYVDSFSQIYLYGESPEYSAEIAKNAKQMLEIRHQCMGENQIMVEAFEDSASQINSIMNIITAFVALVAAISLLVGGIGVMNIMLVSVTERTREIGIRKALGARTNSIMCQFLAEAGIITLIGGIIGIIIGTVGALIVCAAVDIKPAISIVTILFASIFSCGVGLFFGIYPAKKAAKMSPIEALRFEG